MDGQSMEELLSKINHLIIVYELSTARGIMEQKSVWREMLF